MRLWLLRHAKSSWDDPSADDEDRPLATRGERAAGRMRDYLEAHDINPDLVLCSSARRARQTLAGVLPGLGEALEIRIEPTLYTFDVAVLIDRLSRVPVDVSSVLLVGHNPALQELAVRVADRGERLHDLTRKYPTGSLAEIEVSSGSWGALAYRAGELKRFVTPGELDGISQR
ncbi:MAG: histidine phosphatase family protein [Actinomycetota bacterium]